MNKADAQNYIQFPDVFYCVCPAPWMMPEFFHSPKVSSHTLGESKDSTNLSVWLKNYLNYK